MKNFIYPNVYDYKEITTYLSSFVEENKRNEDFSFRVFANRLNWPVSLLSDVISKRRNLTPQRCIEFSNLAKFSSLELERLLLICIKDNLPKNHHDILVQTSSLFSSENKTYRNNNDIKNLFLSYEHIIIPFCIWSRGKMTLEQLKERMPLFNFDPKELDKVTNELVAKKIVKIDKESKISLVKNFQFILDEHAHLDEKKYPGLDFHKNYAQNFIRFCDSPSGPACYNSGIIEIPKGHFNEYADKLLSLREWFLKKHEENILIPKESFEETRLYQLDLNLFNILGPE